MVYQIEEDKQSSQYQHHQQIDLLLATKKMEAIAKN
jgi:hypothetical protein